MNRLKIRSKDHLPDELIKDPFRVFDQRYNNKDSRLPSEPHFLPFKGLDWFESRDSKKEVRHRWMLEIFLILIKQPTFGKFRDIGKSSLHHLSFNFGIKNNPRGISGSLAGAAPA